MIESRKDNIESLKSKLRRRILSLLKAQREEIRCRKSQQIKEELFRSLLFRRARTVMCYVSFGGEVRTQELIKEARQLGKIVAVPVCGCNRRMKPCVFPEDGKLKKGLYGIGEPVNRKFIGCDDIDLIIVPGVAFDKAGNRLGRGKGYYDNFLKRLPSTVPSVGLAYDFQVVPRIPSAEHDTALTKVIFA
ncbi:MAG: 5-formyltetrahydrofolate cyclo-ligase [Candidatus Omnitrophota bacterium]|jgi:5-formyltetrahydrofolate cyclo-ligase|nr:5-formyltetrahydrofolate cyclo-ligase [Candidatus Omnitrophota bacterium]